MDARLPTGERVHVIIAPASRCGTCLTIRKFQRRKLGFAELVAEGVLSQAAADVIEFAVKLHRNIVVSGGTGTGKTTLLNAFSEAIPSAERIIVIEDSSELKLQQPHTIYLEAQVAGKRGAAPITIRDLFVDSLRMRPDRIVVGEVRRGEALDLIQSMLSGHSGALTTVHANSPRDAASRLETLCLLSDAELPIRVARSQVASAIHLVIQLARFVDGSRRVVAVWESRGLNDQEQYTWNPLFHFQPNHEGADCPKGVLKSTRNIPDFLEDAYQYGLADDANHLKERLVLAA